MVWYVLAPGALISTWPRWAMLGEKRFPAGRPGVSVVVCDRPPQYNRAYATCAPGVRTTFPVLESKVVASLSTST
jgi:hypothetical protein